MLESTRRPIARLSYHAFNAGSALQPADDRADQPQHQRSVAAPPRVQVRVVDDGDGRDLGVRVRHAARHRAAHAAQHLERSDLFEDPRDALDVFRRDRVVRPVGVTIARSTSSRWARARTAGVALTRGAAAVGSGAARLGRGGRLESTDDRARIGRCVVAIEELDERLADGQQVAGLGEQAFDAAAAGARDVDDGFLGLDGEQRLILADFVVLRTCQAEISASCRPSPRSGRRNVFMPPRAIRGLPRRFVPASGR